MKNIDIDCCNLYGRRTGVGRYLSNVLSQWAIQGKIGVNLYFKDELSGDSFCHYSGFNCYVVKNRFIKKNQIWTNIFLYLNLLRSNSDIYFTPNYTFPVFPLKKRKVVTIFDISYISNPEWYPVDQRLALRYNTSNTVRTADQIITGSFATKNEIIKYYNVNPGKIQVVHLGVDPALTGDLDTLRYDAKLKLRNKYKLKSKVVLFVGLLMNRRNIDVTISAIGKLNKKHKNTVSLVIIGKDHSYPKTDFQNIIHQSSMASNTLMLDYVSDADLRDFYRGSDCFVCASTCEGFNITPLEAMQLGVPVVSSKCSSLPEVVGTAAEFIDEPTNAESQASSIERVLFNEVYAFELERKGYLQAKKFSWERCADETYSAISPE